MKRIKYIAPNKKGLSIGDLRKSDFTKKGTTFLVGEGKKDVIVTKTTDKGTYTIDYSFPSKQEESQKPFGRINAETVSDIKKKLSTIVSKHNVLKQEEKAVKKKDLILDIQQDIEDDKQYSKTTIKEIKQNPELISKMGKITSEIVVSIAKDMPELFSKIPFYKIGLSEEGDKEINRLITKAFFENPKIVLYFDKDNFSDLLDKRFVRKGNIEAFYNELSKIKDLQYDDKAIFLLEKYGLKDIRNRIKTS